MKALQADKDPRKHGYQFGGEPLPGHHDVLLQRLYCFDHPETAIYCREQIRRMLQACPDLTGVAFDFIGYQNYRCCHCDLSEKLFAAFRQKHRGLGAKRARVQFVLARLAAFTNALADDVRRMKSGAKTAIHAYPTFQPDPLYGNRLNVDYCCQTAAWFFTPYWRDRKIAAHAKTIVRDAKKYFPRQQGIPFVGLYVGRKSADKSVERFAHELRVIFASTGATSLSLYNFDDLVKHPAYAESLKQTVAAFEQKKGQDDR
jgi:hypothetical protein